MAMMRRVIREESVDNLISSRADERRVYGFFRGVDSIGVCYLLMKNQGGCLFVGGKLYAIGDDIKRKKQWAIYAVKPQQEGPVFFTGLPPETQLPVSLQRSFRSIPQALRSMLNDGCRVFEFSKMEEALEYFASVNVDYLDAYEQQHK